MCQRRAAAEALMTLCVLLHVLVQDELLDDGAVGLHISAHRLRSGELRLQGESLPAWPSHPLPSPAWPSHPLPSPAWPSHPLPSPACLPAFSHGACLPVSLFARLRL
jgi:hypothetical protein